MAVDYEIREIESGITEVISGWTLKAFKLGCNVIRIRFSPSGRPLVECYLPVTNSGEVDKPTFAELMNEAARLIITAKMMLADTSLSDKDLGTYVNLVEQVDALEQWIKDAREKEEEQPADSNPKMTEE